MPRNCESKMGMVSILAMSGLLCINIGCVTSLTSQANSAPNMLSSLKRESPPIDDLEPKKSALACFKTAHQLDSQHHVREAIALYERARGLDPKLKNVTRRLAVLYAQSKDNAKAKLEFENAIAESPKDASLRSDVGYYYLEVGDYKNAELHLSESRKLVKSHPKGTVHLAMLRAKQNRLDESLSLFEEVVDSASAHSNLGVILAKLNKRELAIQHLEEAHRLDPSLPAPVAFLEHFRKVVASP